MFSDKHRDPPDRGKNNILDARSCEQLSMELEPQGVVTQVTCSPNLRSNLPSEKPKKSVSKLTITTFETTAVSTKFPEVIAITAPLSDRELKFFGKKPTCPCDTNFEALLAKASEKGLDALTVEELQALHNKICDATAEVLEKLGQSTGVLKPNEGDRLTLLRKIAALEGDLMRKQRHAQQKVIDMQIAVNREKDRLMNLKQSLDREKQKNSELMNQIGSQNPDQRPDQFGDRMDQERARNRRLENELEKERVTNSNLKKLLDSERDKAKQERRRDTAALEEMKNQLEEARRNEALQKLKPKEKTRRKKTPVQAVIPVRDVTVQMPSSTSKARPFYTDLTPGGYARKNFSSSSRNLSSSSNGLDHDDR